jgi:hypothetical protein
VFVCLLPDGTGGLVPEWMFGIGAEDRSFVRRGVQYGRELASDGRRRSRSEVAWI